MYVPTAAQGYCLVRRGSSIPRGTAEEGTPGAGTKVLADDASMLKRPSASGCGSTPSTVPAAVRSGWRSTEDSLIVIGASTGGTEALKLLLLALPETAPAILVVQHMPQTFTGSFARRLDDSCRIHVKEAEHGESVCPGTAYIAPGHSHLLAKRGDAGYIVELSAAAPVNRHRPSVDVLFHAVAACAGHHAIGVILTGMGKDGAAGMLALKHAGAWTIAQDEASCVVYGMPREAVALKAVDEVVPLAEIGARLMSRLCMARHRA
ncbi:MAG: chemotaxis protein CheB [Rhodocyclaceae bacterium]|nr:chemotaxis protein CheB [Rhodocyclaceae bacterium]